MLMPHLHLRPLGLKPKRPLLSALVLGLALSVTAMGQPVGAATTDPDLGDAPASTNNFGVVMQYYPGSPPANFPTVFFAGAQPTGPKHFNSPTVMYLGNGNVGGTITAEGQADVGGDADGINNISPPANTANQDRGDDGPDWTPMGGITFCQQKQFRYWVTVLPGAPTTAYVNSWVDFNNSGRWGDVFACGGLNVDEWIVKNQAITLPGPGVYLFSTPLFNASPNPITQRRWARITLSETPATWNAARVGSGPMNGWKSGETEDYVLP
ncbi:MAG TPA: hypothetical protein VFZ66_17590 [Herpetosiphonaceae bacterium]